MTHFGRNLKLSVDAARRDAVRRFYQQGFGCEHKPAHDRLDQFIFAAGESLGVFYVDADKALPDSAWEFAPWLEFLVDDVPAAEARLLDAGAVRVEFMDKTHPYLRGPGGPVFRLAKRAGA